MRSIYALINSAFAGDPITAVEATRILRYMQHQKRVDAWLMRDSSPADRERADGADIGDGFMSYRAMILRDLRKFTVPELRQVVRTQLVMLGMFCELQAASSGGQDRQRRQAVQAARQSATTRRTEARSFLDTIAAIKARRPAITSDVDAAQRYLRDTDPDFSSGSKAGKRKVAVITRRIRRARTKTGYKRR